MCGGRPSTAVETDDSSPWPILRPSQLDSSSSRLLRPKASDRVRGVRASRRQLGLQASAVAYLCSRPVARCRAPVRVRESRAVRRCSCCLAAPWRAPPSVPARRSASLHHPDPPTRVTTTARSPRSRDFHSSIGSPSLASRRIARSSRSPRIVSGLLGLAPWAIPLHLTSSAQDPRRAGSRSLARFECGLVRPVAHRAFGARG